MVNIVKLLEQVGETFFVVVIDHSVDIVNLSDVGVVHLKVLGEAVRVLLFYVPSPALPVLDVALNVKDEDLTELPTGELTFVVLSSLSFIILSKASLCLNTFLQR